ncbi:hypothetical protein Tsubulata_003449 [Turnera subulata]|uniref:Alpha/beta hydrolase fold-3 domain-containing protein n=1 Tax=Turnera subulata TaxID=218843 RepID=A0A9Q0JK60_9ROSI|nr:hypothetical protein Tsubulata_003449 [Turnera subulata]
MESNTSEIAHEFVPFFRVYKDGKVERITGTKLIPPCIDPQTGVESKDTVFSPENNLSARLFIPKPTNRDKKLPVLIYIHGGAFCIESPFSTLYHNHLTTLVNKANVVAVSIQYRRAPEHPLPAAYDDAWAAIQWVASHAKGDGPEPWLNQYADLDRAFIAGDSAGANIAHNMAVKAGVSGLVGVKLVALVMVHPYFMKGEPDSLIKFIFPSNQGSEDPRINPASCDAGRLELSKLGCSRVLVFVAGNDWLRDRGLSYYEALKGSGYSGVVDLVETEGEEHVFHLFNPEGEKVEPMLQQFVSFIHQV